MPIGSKGRVEQRLYLFRGNAGQWHHFAHHFKTRLPCA
jgi:hypothetical protein